MSNIINSINIYTQKAWYNHNKTTSAPTEEPTLKIKMTLVGLTGSNNTLFNSIMFNAIDNMYLDSECYDIDDLDNQGGGSGSSSGLVDYWVGLPDGITGDHIVELEVEDGFVFKHEMIAPHKDFYSALTKIEVPDEYKVQYTINNEFVDLGLPSGIKWAKCNLGAVENTDCGLYFQWASADGYEGDDAAAHSVLKTARYIKGNGNIFKYNTDETRGIVDNKTTLDDCDNPAKMIMGEEYDMPTPSDCNELVLNTTQVCTEDYNNTGVKGLIIFKSKSNNDKAKCYFQEQNKWKSYSSNSIGYYTDQVTSAPENTYNELVDEHIFMPVSGYYSYGENKNYDNFYLFTKSIGPQSPYTIFGSYNGVRTDGIAPRYLGLCIRCILR